MANMMFGQKTSTSFSFGPTNPSTAQSTTFGAATSTTPRPLFGTTAPQSSMPSLFGNAPATSTVASLFGAKPTVSTSLFGSNTTSTASTGMFGSSSTGGLFSKPNASAGFGVVQKPLFGGVATPANTSSIGARASLHTLVQNADALVGSVSKVELYGDERDATITKLNQIGAVLGAGSAHYKKDAPVVQYSSIGPFYRFKCIGYSTTSNYSETDGYVLLIVNVPHSQLSTSEQRQKFVDALFVVLESKAELKAHIESVQPLPNGSTKVVLYVTQKDLGRVKASQLAAFFQQPNKKAMLETQLKVDKDQIAPILAMDSQHKKIYLSTIPTGMEEIMWEQAIRENPDPSELIPFPVRGFDQLKARQKANMAQVEMQKKALLAMENRCAELEAGLAREKGRLASTRVMHKELSHRLLRVAAMQVISVRLGHGSDLKEEEIQSALEGIHARINAPNHIKFRLFELKRRCESEGGQLKGNSAVGDALSKTDIQQLRRYLSKCQDGLESLVGIVNRNMQDLSAMHSLDHR